MEPEDVMSEQGYKMLMVKCYVIKKNYINFRKMALNAAFTLSDYSGFRLLVLGTNATEHLTTTQNEISFLRPRPRLLW